MAFGKNIPEYSEGKHFEPLSALNNDFKILTFNTIMLKNLSQFFSNIKKKIL
jgi:hypothetical protein